MTIRKSEFYSKTEGALTAKGYLYFDGDRDIKGKGDSTPINRILSPSKAAGFISEKSSRLRKVPSQAVGGKYKIVTQKSSRKSVKKLHNVKKQDFYHRKSAGMKLLFAVR